MSWEEVRDGERATWTLAGRGSRGDTALVITASRAQSSSAPLETTNPLPALCVRIRGHPSAIESRLGSLVHERRHQRQAHDEHTSALRL